MIVGCRLQSHSQVVELGYRYVKATSMCTKVVVVEGISSFGFWLGSFGLVRPHHHVTAIR